MIHALVTQSYKYGNFPYLTLRNVRFWVQYNKSKSAALADFKKIE